MSAATIAASLRFSRRTGDLPRGGHYSATEGKYWTLWVLPECRLLLRVVGHLPDQPVARSRRRQVSDKP